MKQPFKHEDFRFGYEIVLGSASRLNDGSGRPGPPCTSGATPTAWPAGHPST